MLLLFALAIVMIGAGYALMVLSNKATEKLDSFDASASAGGLLASLFKK